MTGRKGRVHRGRTQLEAGAGRARPTAVLVVRVTTSAAIVTAMTQTAPEGSKRRNASHPAVAAVSRMSPTVEPTEVTACASHVNGRLRLSTIAAVTPGS